MRRNGFPFALAVVQFMGLLLWYNEVERSAIPCSIDFSP